MGGGKKLRRKRPEVQDLNCGQAVIIFASEIRELDCQESRRGTFEDFPPLAPPVVTSNPGKHILHAPSVDDNFTVLPP